MDTKTRILVVDDEELIVELLESYLERKGFEIFTASSGFKAFAILKENPQIDLVISDIRMADGTGVELLEKINSELTKKHAE